MSLMLPMLSSPQWRQAASFTLGSNGNNGTGASWVRVFNAYLFANVTGSQVRLTIGAGNPTGFAISSLYFGVLSGSYSFDGTQVPITYQGSNSSIVVPANTKIITDPINYKFDPSKNYAISWYFSSGGNVPFNTGYTGTADYWKTGNDAATTSKSGYTNNGQDVSCIYKIEVA